MNVAFISPTGSMGKSFVVLNFVISFLQEFTKDGIQVLDFDNDQLTITKKMIARKKLGLSVCPNFHSESKFEQLQNRKILNICDFKGGLDDDVADLLTTYKFDRIIVVSDNTEDTLLKTQFMEQALKNANYDYRILLNAFNTDAIDLEDLGDYIDTSKLFKNIIAYRGSYVSKTVAKGGLPYGMVTYDKVISNPFFKVNLGLHRTKKEINNVTNEIVEYIGLKIV